MPSSSTSTSRPVERRASAIADLDQPGPVARASAGARSAAGRRRARSPRARTASRPSRRDSSSAAATAVLTRGDRVQADAAVLVDDDAQHAALAGGGDDDVLEVEPAGGDHRLESLTEGVTIGRSCPCEDLLALLLSSCRARRYRFGGPQSASPRRGRMATHDRRPGRSTVPAQRFLAGGGLLLVAACTGSSPVLAPRLTADQRLARRVSAEITVLAAAYAADDRHPPEHRRRTGPAGRRARGARRRAGRAAAGTARLPDRVGRSQRSASPAASLRHRSSRPPRREALTALAGLSGPPPPDVRGQAGRAGPGLPGCSRRSPRARPSTRLLVTA